VRLNVGTVLQHGFSAQEIFFRCRTVDPGLTGASRPFAGCERWRERKLANRFESARIKHLPIGV
jgi:hypothetical protein